MKTVKVGQRWKWIETGREFIIEITDVSSHGDASCVVVQVIGNPQTRFLGQYGSASLHLEDWILLEGQDKP